MSGISDSRARLRTDVAACAPVLPETAANRFSLAPSFGDSKELCEAIQKQERSTRACGTYR
jgi:hypothetical protein